MTNSNNKWKKRFLSSSLPLEFEVTKILADKKFMVTNDYSFFRKTDKEFKEFSADLKGLLLFPLNNNNDIKASLNVLIECKYRDEGKKWLFLPDLNKTDVANQVLGYGIRVLGEFSKKEIKTNPIYNFESKVEFGLKGIELNVNTGEVFDTDIRHGINQLKYALPYLVMDSIEGNLWGHFDDIVPDFIIPILVTNADLFKLKKNFRIDDMNHIDSIDEIADKVPYLMSYSDIGPDFTEHHKEVFKNFEIKISNNKNLEKIERLQSTYQSEYSFYKSPSRCCNELEKSYKSTLIRYYTHFFICSFDNLDNLMKKILKLIPKTIRD